MSEIKEKIKYYFDKYFNDLDLCDVLGFDDEIIEMLEMFMNDVLEKNKSLNLTRIVDVDEFIVKHYIDSCEMFHVKQFWDKVVNNENINIIDVGTGAGFPGMPLAILLKNKSNKIKFTLTDSLNKRIAFLNQEVDKLKLNSFINYINLVHNRAEDLAHDKLYREKFDFALSRGVAKINILSEYLLPFVKPNSYICFYKLFDINPEISSGLNAIKLLGGDTNYNYFKYDLNNNFSQNINPDFNNQTNLNIQNNSLDFNTENYQNPTRAIFVFNKIKATKNIYPRKAGIPAKTPL